jgi:hypothetical protein
MNKDNIFQLLSILTIVSELAYPSPAMPLSLPTVQGSHGTHTGIVHTAYKLSWQVKCMALVSIWRERENTQSSSSPYAYVNLLNRNKRSQPFFYTIQL